ncbi:histone H1 [Striga asiatica]|uniref:Histone H1 n=1 Tax=Striga asiatica TaxID=4170 RepID=A0A5A7QT07_STRAF|nr:histone H1 [Striga asiatica]
MASDELPPYSQMILEAIDTLKQPDGVPQSSISDYIESKYGQILPPEHEDSLATHLAQMKDTGNLVLANNGGYLRPTGPESQSAPAKRGRGRPPKPKDPLAPAAAPPANPPRPRGRPPGKAHSADAEPAAKKPKPAASSTGRPRGRPRKVKPAEAVETGIEA